MGARGPLPSPYCDYIVALYLRGELATLEEGALIAGVSRSRVRALLKAAGVDWQRSRDAYIAKHRTRAVARCEGRVTKRQTKRELRRLATHAKREWDRKNAT